MEIGDTIDSPQDTGAPRKRSRRDARPAVTDVATENGRGRKRNGTSARSRGNGNGRNGGGDTPELTALLAALRDLRDGDFTVRLESSDDEMLDEIATAFNGIAERNEKLHQL